MIHLFAVLSNEEADMEVQKIIERSLTLKRHFGANRQVGTAGFWQNRFRHIGGGPRGRKQDWHGF